MSRKIRKTREAEGPSTPGLENAETPASPSPAVNPATRTVRSVLLIVILSVFAIFMVTVVALFSGGESIQWKKELAVIDAKYAEGESTFAAIELEKFGGRWPESVATVPWNEKAGLYFGAAGMWDKSAHYYRRAVEIDDEKLKARKVINPTATIRARAGEALLKAGKPEEAIPYYQAELKLVSRAVGAHDLANFGLGLIYQQQGRIDQALQNFESIANREKYSKEIDEFYATLKNDILDPVRAESQTISADQL